MLERGAGCTLTYSRGLQLPRWLRRISLVGVLITLAALAGAMPAGAQGSPLSVADFDQRGLETVVLASFDAGGDTTLFAAADSRWGAVGTLVEGDVAFDDDTSITRVMLPNSDGSLLRLNDSDGDNDGLVLRDFFGQSGTGADLTVWVQTSSGTVNFAASDTDTVGKNYVNFNVPTSSRAVVSGIDTGDRFLLALTRPAPNTAATGDPTITGTAQVGQTLTAGTSGITDAEGLSNVAYSYQWLADDAEIADATASTYTLTEAEEGKAIEVRVSFNDDEGNDEERTSVAMVAVAAAPAPNTAATGDPTITGTAQVGQTLTVGTSAISDADGLTNVAYSYQWLADDAEITDATASTYALTEAEQGKAIKVRVSFNDDEGNDEERTSAGTAAVEGAPPSAISDDATLSALALSDLSLSPAFAGVPGTYAVDAPVEVTVTTVSSTTTDDWATVTITPSDADGTADNGHQVSLDYGKNTIGVLVTAQDGVSTTTYTVTVDRARRWPAARAREWGDNHGWLVGANYVPRYAINQLEHWQADTFDIEIIEEELGWAADLGMNVMRVYLHDLLYKQDSTGFLDRIEQYLEVADRHDIATILVFFDDVWNPDPQLGTQPGPTPGVHNSGWVQSPGRAILGDLAAHDSLKPYVAGVISHFDVDDRVIAFELYNEPSNSNPASYGTSGQNIELASKSKYSLALLEKAFEWARETNPAQPVFASLWRTGKWKNDSGQFIGWDRLHPIDRFAAQHSDIIGFHSYLDIDLFRTTVEQMTSIFDRPIMATEYMGRPWNTFELMLPVLQEHGVGAINWGLVSGKSQTIYDWGTRRRAQRGSPNPWFHDVLKPNCAPYDPDEVDLIRQLTGTTSENEIPTFGEGAEAFRILAENTGTDQKVGDAVSAQDGDGGMLEYLLEGADADSFSIVGTTGQLGTLEEVDYDYEVMTSYTVKIRVEDGQCGANTIDVTIGLLDAPEPPTLTDAEAAGLTARFDQVPSGHDGSSQFKFRVYFSDEVKLSYSEFSRRLFRTTGGWVLNARRSAPPSNIGWEVEARPNGAGAMVITLPAGRACDTPGAVCAPGGDRLSATITATIPGPAPSVTSPAYLTVAEGTTAVAALTAIDADTPAAGLTWSIPPGGGVDAAKFAITTAGALSFTDSKDFENPDDASGDGIYKVTVRVTDGARSATDVLWVALSDVNEAPTTEAGDDQANVAQGAKVTLSGSGTDPDSGDTLSYWWTQTVGDTVSLSATGTATTTFTAPTGLSSDTTLTFTLRVTDAGSLYAEDSVTVTVTVEGLASPDITSGTSYTVLEGVTSVGRWLRPTRTRMQRT